MKLRSFLGLLLAAVVILVGASLPDRVGSWQDKNDNGLVSYAKASDVHLQLAGEGELSIRHKLSLLAHYSSSMEIPESLAKLSSTEVSTVLEETIGMYQELGLISRDFPVISKTDLTCTPFLVYWDDAKTRSNIFWIVEYYYTGNIAVTMILDDQTETVCTVYYSDENLGAQWTADTEAEQSRRMEEMRSGMEYLCTAFLDGLGPEFDNYDVKTILASGNTVWTDTLYYTTSVSWSDILFGQVYLDFSLYPSGFYVSVY